MRFHISFQCDGSAFSGDGGFGETAAILRRIADKVERNEHTVGAVIDSNGSTVGNWGFVVPVSEAFEDRHTNTEEDAGKFERGRGF